MAAISYTLLNLASKGGTILASPYLYGGTIDELDVIGTEGNQSLVAETSSTGTIKRVTVGGISNIATDLSGWQDTDNGKAYYVGNANGFGVDENRMYISYVQANDLTPIIEFSV